MAISTELPEALLSLHGHAVRYNKFKENPQLFLDELHRMGTDWLQKYLRSAEKTVKTKKDGVPQVAPVIFLRWVLVTRILSGDTLTLKDLDEIAERIEERDVEYFKGFPKFLPLIANLKEWSRSPFANWDHFRFLFYIDYFFHAKEVQDSLRDLATAFRDELGLDDADYHLAGFDHNQNFGTDRCWLALYPEERDDHKNSVQLFLGVFHDRFGFGLHRGSRVEGVDPKTTTLPPSEPDIEKVFNTLSDLVPEYLSLNRRLVEVVRNGKTVYTLGDKPGKGRKLPRPSSSSLNTILYGPPGTGKTHAVRERAVRIIEGSSENTTSEEINQRFKTYLQDRRIEFITFHPSYSYEEFVEGFRYDPETKIPELRDGVLRRLVSRALNPYQKPSSPEGARIWKVSLWTNEGDAFSRCMKNDQIAVGFLDEVDLTGMDQEGIREKFVAAGGAPQSSGINTLDYLVNGMQDGDFVAVLKSQREIRAVGIVGGPYQYETGHKWFRHTRPVEWIDKGVHDIYEMNSQRLLSQSTIYPLDRIRLEDFVTLFPKESEPETDAPYVLIIDEINRGNLARIFGELITLLEPDKRKGAPNELSIRLPYSQDAFTMPANLHVIGTMNTADRSIALMDVALRRRFDFEEVRPDVEVIREVMTVFGDDETQDDFELAPKQVELICGFFETLNRRITVLLDRDHQIGHSYFMRIRSVRDLHRVLYRQVFPLLQEYFYNDRERLTRLLGEWSPKAGAGFIKAPSSDYAGVFLDQSLSEDEVPWELHEYDPGEISEAIRNTFFPQDPE